jgi:transcriptional regulator with XRE-family HTH domain
VVGGLPNELRHRLQPVCKVAQSHKEGDHCGVGDAETIGQRIRRERLARDMTQRDLAERVGVGVPHISKVEAGRESPGDPLLLRLAEVFEVEAEELFLVARRLPDEIAEEFAADPEKVLAFYRTLRGGSGRR